MAAACVPCATGLYGSTPGMNSSSCTGECAAVAGSLLFLM